MRNTIYKKQIAEVEAREARGEVIVIRPERPIEVARMERDTRKLLALYDEGYAAAASVEFVIE
jgi:predicted patatin/cPLA2 family phospholipase